MGKRSNFKRIDRDYYRTWDTKAIKALAPHLQSGFGFVEPCAGDYTLVRQIEDLGLVCEGAYDIEPNSQFVTKLDALELGEHHLNGADLIITNPPWDRSKKNGELLHKLIERFANLRPTWLLFDSDWAYTQQSKPLIEKYCTDIVVVGRLKWIEGTNQTGKDNCAWYRFDKNKISATLFHA